MNYEYFSKDFFTKHDAFFLFNFYIRYYKELRELELLAKMIAVHVFSSRHVEFANIDPFIFFYLYILISFI